MSVTPIAQLNQQVAELQDPGNLGAAQALDQLLDATIQQLASEPLKDRPIRDCEALQAIVEFCSGFAKRLAASGTATAAQQANLRAKVLAAKCGGLVSFEYFQQHADFTRFVETNYLHNKFMTLHMRLTATGAGVPQLPATVVQKADRHLPWSAYRQEPGIGQYPCILHREDQTSLAVTTYVPWDRIERIAQTDASGTVTGYQYRDMVGHRVYFETDATGFMKQDYSFNHMGILQYDIKDPETILPFDVRDPREWDEKYVLEICTEIIDKEGRDIQRCLGDHTYLIMRNGVTGEIFSIGNFAKEFSGWDFVTPLAHKHQCLETPDRYICVPKGEHSIQSRQIELTAEQYKAMLDRWKGDKCNPDLTFSAMKKNCTTWCVKVVEEVLGVELDARMSLPEFLLRQLPAWEWKFNLIANAKHLINQLPDFAQKALYFIPLYYIPWVIGGLVAKLFSLGSCDGETDLPLIDIFFRPWNISIDQPLILRQNLADMSDEDIAPTKAGVFKFGDVPGSGSPHNGGEPEEEKA